MITDDQVVALLGRANPVPSLDLLDPITPVNAVRLIRESERSRKVTELKTLDKGHDNRRRVQRPRLLVALGAVFVIALGMGTFLVSQERNVATTPLDRATAFWTAVVNGDREAALALIAPDADPNVANTHGRAQTLEGQFDWYETVGFQWQLEECVPSASFDAECTASARNAWSDALAVEPVSGSFGMLVDESGLVYSIVDIEDSFLEAWSPQVFEVFANWVRTNHPEDATVMFEFTVDINPNILDLYRLNTERFVAEIGG